MWLGWATQHPLPPLIDLLLSPLHPPPTQTTPTPASSPLSLPPACLALTRCRSRNRPHPADKEINTNETRHKKQTSFTMYNIGILYNQYLSIFAKLYCMENIFTSVMKKIDGFVSNQPQTYSNYHLKADQV